jgi:uncharacterized membrane protein YcaP (DUF421 family)
MFAQPDWDTMFSPTLSLFEVFLRGTIMYLFIFALLRVVRRETGSISVADVLILVLIADAAQNGMSGEYASITEGLLLVGTIVFWSVLVDLVGYYFEPVGKLLHPRPIDLIKDGALMRANLRKNFITDEELMSAVRQAGTEDVTKVQRAWLEGNGEVSVALRD